MQASKAVILGILGSEYIKNATDICLMQSSVVARSKMHAINSSIRCVDIWFRRKIITNYIYALGENNTLRTRVGVLRNIFRVFKMSLN